MAEVLLAGGIGRTRVYIDSRPQRQTAAASCARGSHVVSAGAALEQDGVLFCGLEERLTGVVIEQADIAHVAG